MDAGNPRREVPDVREYLAAERTFLAYLRTGLALMGFGFVVARLPLVGMPVPPHGGAAIPLGVGTALVLLGAALNLVALVEYRRMIHRLNSVHQADWRAARTPAAVAILLAVCGFLIAVYLPFSV